MKCPICGTVSFGDSTCPGCGNYLSGNNNDRADIGNSIRPVSFSQSVSPGVNTVNTVKINPPKKAVIIIMVICFVLLTGYYFITRNTSKTYDMGSFSISLPFSMKEVTGSDFTKHFTDLGMDAGLYENSYVRFAYAVSDDYSADMAADGVGREEYENINSSLNINNIAASYRNLSADDYTEYEKTSDTIRFCFKDNTGTKGYCHTKLIAHNNRWYVFYLFCNKSSQQKYEKKFQKWMESIEFG